MKMFQVPVGHAQGLAELLDGLATTLRGGPKEEPNPERDAAVEVLHQMTQDPNVPYTACIEEVRNWTKSQCPDGLKTDDYLHHCYLRRQESAIHMFDAMLDAFKAYEGKPMLQQLEGAFWSTAKAFEQMCDQALGLPLIDVPVYLRCMGGLQALSGATGLIRMKLDQERTKIAATDPLHGGKIGADKTAVAD